MGVLIYPIFLSRFIMMYQGFRIYANEIVSLIFHCQLGRRLMRLLANLGHPTIDFNALFYATLKDLKSFLTKILKEVQSGIP